jgi:prolyl 4-hydroxylase
MAKLLDDEWKTWARINVARGCDLDGIFKILADEGFDYHEISRHLDYIPSRNLENIVNPEKARAHLQSGDGFSGSVGLDRDRVYLANARRLDTSLAEFYTLDNFLNREECERLIALIKSRLRPSEIANAQVRETGFRTSSTCDLGTIGDDFVADIDRRICSMLGIDASYSEVIQGQYYEVGQEFKAHTDYFEADEFEQYARERGQRTYTFFIYLNDVEDGGETAFPLLKQTIKPRQGNAVVWCSLDEDGRPNGNTMHQAHPVTAGYKAVITKWFRAKGSGPMMCKDNNELLPAYTAQGFHKSALDPSLFQEITQFYQANASTTKTEHVDGGFIYKAGDSLPASSLVELSDGLRRRISDALLPLLSEWSGVDLQPSYVYGIRTYHRGAVLKEHRDREKTHIISAIINVAQQLEQDWYLHIDDNYYRRHKLILKPGEIVFYEGARLLHGRPEPLIGESYANVFCHFMPSI